MSDPIKWEALWTPYSKDGVSIEMTRSWLVSEGKARGFGPEVVQSVMDEMFLELSKGKDFTDKCFCGCDSPRAHTHINHWALNRCIEVGKYLETIVTDLREKQLNQKIEAFAKGMPGLEGYNDLDDLYDMLEAVYTKLNGQDKRDQLEAERLHYYRKVLWWKKPLGRFWKEDLWPLIKRSFNG